MRVTFSMSDSVTTLGSTTNLMMPSSSMVSVPVRAAGQHTAYRGQQQYMHRYI